MGNRDVVVSIRTRLGLLVVMSAVALNTASKAEDEGQLALPEIVVETKAPSATKAKIDVFDLARARLFAPAAATAQTLDRAAIDRQPQGGDTPFDKLLVQLPGVSSDSAASRPDVHVRNEYANVQYRINGILLPDSVSGLGPILDTSFVGTLSLLDGALPAQYGLRTAGVLDITSRSFDHPQGSVGIYGGSHGTVSTTLDYGGLSGATQYFVALRGFRSDAGIENPTPSYNAIHDVTDQGKAFGYLSRVLSDSARLTVMAGVSDGEFEIPDVPGRMPLGDFGGNRVPSALLDERETNRYAFALAALQMSGERFDGQLSLDTRYAQDHFAPDVRGDLAFDDVASDIERRSTLVGLHYDGAYRLDDRQTIRMGIGVTGERTDNDNQLFALPLDGAGTPLPDPVSFRDDRGLLGFGAGGYAQDDIKLLPTLTLIAGARFDHLDQYVTASQLSPRLGLVWQADPATTLHAGYARYFTPPSQSEASSSTIGLAAGTTLQADVPLADPVKPERSHYVDVGADRDIAPGLDIGGDAYLKLATDYLDDGEFGDTLAIAQVNYAKAYGEGVEVKTHYRKNGFTAYANLSTNRTKVTGPVSNQYVFDAADYQYISSHYIFADDAQLVTASAGAAYQFGDTLVSANMIYGSGLRSGFANLAHVPAYASVNLGLAETFHIAGDPKPLTARFDIVNLFDTVYQLRDGSGIGVEAPQYGARRGFFFGLSKSL